MRLYQVEIGPVRPFPRSGRSRFQLVRAEGDDLARSWAKSELCRPGEHVFWVSEVPEGGREAALN
jgi:hypothetical protein